MSPPGVAFWANKKSQVRSTNDTRQFALCPVLVVPKRVHKPNHVGELH